MQGVPEYLTTTTPAAGWYADPANASLERWWGGVEWTDTTRPIQVVTTPPAPAAPPGPAVPGGGVNPFATQVPGGGINPFANEIKPDNSRLAAYDPASAFSVAPSRGFGPGSTGPQVAQSWYSEPSRGWEEQPSNGVSTAGLILSLLGLYALGIICSAIGLSKARGFERRGLLPVGRKRARWGLGLGITGFLLLSTASVLYVLYLPQIVTWATNYAIENSLLSEQLGDQELGPIAGDPEVTTLGQGGDIYTPEEIAASYVRSDFEAGASALYFELKGLRPDSVACPDSIVATSGSSFACAISAQDGSHEFRWTFIDDSGTVETFIDGVQVA